MNSLKCPKSNSVSHCLTELFQFYQNKHWTIQRRDERSVDPSYYIEDCRISVPIESSKKKNSSNLESKKIQIRRHKCSNSIVNDDVDSCDKFNLCRNLTVCTRYVLIF